MATDWGMGGGYVEPGVSDEQKPDARQAAASAKPTRGPAKEPTDWAKELYALDRAQHDRIERRIVEHRVNQRRRDGESNVWVFKRQDQGIIDIYTPPGSSKAPIPIYNKSARLCARIGSYVMSDPPQPQVEPKRDDDESKDAAAVAQQALEQIIGPEGLNLEEQVRRGIDQSHSCGTSYLVLWVDPYGGGQQPVEVEAHPTAQTLDDATHDPATGLPHPPEDLTRRFLAKPQDGQPDNLLTDQEHEADLQWRPLIKAEVLRAAHVLFLPAFSTIHDAHGCLVREYSTWGKLKARYPDLADMDETAVRELCLYRPPKGWRELLPLKNGKPTEPRKTEDVPVDDLICAHIRMWLMECPEYPEGKFVAVIGKDKVVEESDWAGTDPKGRFKLDLPIVPVQLWRKDSDPWGSESVMDILGPAGEARAAVMGMWFDYLDKIGRRKVFVPQTSIYSGKEALLDYLTYVPMNPGGEPHYEDIPPMPPEIPEMAGNITQEMDDAILSATAQGADNTPDVSGRARLASISQVQANLSDAQSYVRGAFVRAWKLCLQLARKFYTVPQTAEWMGEDGEYQVTRWMGSDLVGAHDIAIKPGTGTMLTPQQKIDQALALQQSGVIQLPDVLESIGQSMGALIGLRDNPHRHRIRRQIAQWEQGPPEGQVQQPPPPPQVDPMSGMPIPPQPMGPQPDPRGLAIFTPIPVDVEPAVAGWRAREIGRTMAGVKYAGFPKEWQLALDQAYMTAVTALQPPPVNPMPGAPQQAPPPSPSAAPALTPNEMAEGGMTNTQATGSTQ